MNVLHIIYIPFLSCFQEELVIVCLKQSITNQNDKNSVKGFILSVEAASLSATAGEYEPYSNQLF